MIVTVDGLEMFGFIRPPGAAECDSCGIRVQMRGRRYHRLDLPTTGDLQAIGWRIEHDRVGSPSTCPECSLP